MSLVNIVFRKVKEISARSITPRPMVSVYELANELSISGERLHPYLAELKSLRLLTYAGGSTPTVKLTLLGCVVKREK
jgi:DNA-binding IclR family transcriptional regulator